MTKRRRESKPERFVSKRQLSKWQRQKRLRNITMGIGLGIIVAIVAIMGLGYYDTQIRPMTRAAIKVNDTTFDMRYFIEVLKLYRGINNGSVDQSLANLVEQQIAQMEIQKQAARALGIEVNRSDVESDLKKSGAPVTRERIDIGVSSKVIEKLRSDYFGPKVAASQPQAQLQAMLIETKAAAARARERLQAGESFAKLAEELSKDSVTKSKKGDLGWVTGHEAGLLLNSKKIEDILATTGKGVNDPAYDDSVDKSYGYWVVKATEKKPASDDGKTPAQVHALGILVASEQDAAEAMDKLNSGTDFQTLATQVSLQPGVKEGTAGPDMGWLINDDKAGDFVKAVINLPVDVVSGPIGDSRQRTPGGYWLLNVQERDDNKELTSDQKNTLVGELVNQWAEGLAKDPAYKVERLIDADMMSYAIKQASAVNAIRR
ncbi:MAG: peptidylprolyl isomerase [Chloroflexi bacterium]|nr:peptidylprolyl isomerase [Chloroflexota bacterium]